MNFINMNVLLFRRLLSAIALLVAAGVFSPRLARAVQVTEQNAYDRFAIDIQRDGLVGSGAINDSGNNASGHEEFVEIRNDAGSSLNLNNFVVQDTELSNPTTATNGTASQYDFAFGASTGVSLATGQAMLITAYKTDGSPNGGTSFVPRNFGGSIVYTKNQSFVQTSLTLPNGSGGTRNVTYDTSSDFGFSRTIIDASAVYDGTTSSNTLVAKGPARSTTGSPASFRWNSDSPGTSDTDVSLHGSVNGVNASPGLRSDGSSWVTPTQDVTKVTGTGTVSGSLNSWSVDLGTVGVGATVNITLALGNSAGLGGILSAVGDATLTSASHLALTSGGSQTLFLMGGESTNNYGTLGTINGVGYSDLASAANLLFTVNTATPGVISGVYHFAVRNGYSIINGLTGSPNLGGGDLAITFSGLVAAPEPSAVFMFLVGAFGILRYAGRKRRVISGGELT